MFKMFAPIGLLLVLASCSNNNPPSPPTGAPPEPPNVSPAQAPKTSANFNSNSPIYPKGAQYTIFCARIDGDLHVERANKLKNDLIAATGMKDWYVIHDNAQSLLYYGYYRTISDANDAAETTRAQNDRKKIDLMADKMGDRPFHGALFVALDAPDPSAPPQWNLVNALGAYSLQIAVYKDNPQRKEAAVETVREARAQGVEAYYYHGETSSLVCIGAWPESAVRINDANSAQGNDPEQPVMVLPQTKDPELDHAFEQSAEQANVRVVKPSVEILDPTLKAAMEKYPYNAMNGMYTRRMVNGIEQYDSSLLVPIPHSAASAAQSVPATPQPAYQLPQQAPAPPQPQAGMGTLRSIGD